ncbi:MAG TPA: glycosyltransferase family 39 protein [Flavobacterium sp.]|nr:glycosyltransferase family 39 protein [Flavobacterium sp.]
MKKYLPIIAILSLVKLCIHLIGNRNYGFHRDELLHLSVSLHLDWGYMEFPPFIAWIGKLAYVIFGYSLSGVRIFPTLAGITILVLCCLMAKELGGKSKSVMLAGVSVLMFLPYFRNHCLFQPVAFDQLFWTMGFYFLLRYVNTQNNKYLVFLGITAGFGLMNKYTFLIWGIGIVAGLLFYEKGKLFRNKWLYVSGLVAFLIFVPNIIWQVNHHFPILMHLEALKKSQLDEIGPYDFLLDQLSLPLTFVLALIGLLAFFFDQNLKKHKSFGVAVLVIFAVMWITQSKSYYFFAAYPILFAAGAVKIEKFFQNKPNWNYAVMAVLILPKVYYIPKLIPVLPIEDFVRYEHLRPDNSGHIELTGDYADMFGWNEQVKLVDSIYKSLPTKDKANCIIFAGNYGEAGAIEILGKPYNLPDPVCANGSFWLWGTGNTNGETCITIGVEKGVVEHLFEECRLVKIITHKYAIDEENNIPVYICHMPKVDIRKIWPTLEKRVFE